MTIQERRRVLVHRFEESSQGLGWVLSSRGKYRSDCPSAECRVEALAQWFLVRLRTWIGEQPDSRGPERKQTFSRMDLLCTCGSVGVHPSVTQFDGACSILGIGFRV